jgi:uncharacterized membrane protein
MLRRRPTAAAATALRLSISALLVAGLLAMPSAVGAADPISVTTSFPSVAVAPGAGLTFPLTITSNQPRTVDLAVTGVPTGWSAQLRGGGFTVESVTADPKSPGSVSLEITPGPDATSGVFHMTVEATSGSLSASLPLSVRIAEAAGGNMTMTSDNTTLKGTPDQTFTFNMTINNNTPQDQTFTVAAQGPDGWTVTAQPATAQATSLKVTAGSTGTFTVTANAPTTVTADTYPILVGADPGNGQPLQAQLAVQITGTYKLTLSTPTQVLNANAQAGSPTNLTLTVANTGSGTLTNIKLTSTPPTNWNVSFGPSNVVQNATIASLDPNKTADITATITPASDAITGDYVLTITATASESAATASADFRITVVTSLIWGLVAVVIIVLVLAGLFYVFRRYGRR